MHSDRLLYNVRLIIELYFDLQNLVILIVVKIASKRSAFCFFEPFLVYMSRWVTLDYELRFIQENMTNCLNDKNV